MSCYNPVVVPSKAKDARPGQTQYVPCGKCYGCLLDKQRIWIYRLERHQATKKHCLFVTLTYDESYVPMKLLDYCREGEIVRYKDYVKRKSISNFVFTVYPPDSTNYWKRLRKALPYTDLSYYLCAEYGDEFNRPHMHAAIFYDYPDDPALVEFSIDKAWPYGYVTIEPLIPNRIKYLTKYMLKGDQEAPPSPDCLPCFHRNSQGLGLRGMLDDWDYFDKIGHELDYKCVLSDGSPIAQPRYLRQKIGQLYCSDDKFTCDKIQIQDVNRRKKQQKEFNRFRQDYILAHGKCDFDVVWSAFLHNTDHQERSRNLRLIRKSKI